MSPSPVTVGESHLCYELKVFIPNICVSLFCMRLLR